MKNFFTIFVALMIFLSGSTAFASEKLIEASGSYIMDSRLDETPASATARAREEAKRAAVEKAGVYLQSYSKTIDLELDTDIVQTVAARLLKIQDESNNVEVVEKNLLKFTVTIKALVNDLSDADLKAMMQDKQTLEELTRKNQELQEKYDALNRQMKEYRDKFDTASDAEKDAIKQNVKLNSEHFSAVDEMARGNDFYFAKNYAQALAAYDESIRLNPQLAEAYNNRGIVKYELQQFAEAVADYTAAIRLKSNFADALNNRGNACAALGQFQNAERDLQAALKFKDNAAIRNNLGSVYLSQKKFDAAINEYNRALQSNPNYAEAHYNRAVAYYAQGNLVKALLDMKAAVVLNPTDKAIQDFYGKINSKAS